MIGEHTNRINLALYLFMKSLPLFSTFREKDLNTITPEISIEKYSFRDEIVKVGQTLTSLYVVKSGRIRVDDDLLDY